MEDGHGAAGGYLQRLMRQTGLRIGARSAAGSGTSPNSLAEQNQVRTTAPSFPEEVTLTDPSDQVSADTRQGNAVTTIAAAEDSPARPEPESGISTRQHAPAVEPGMNRDGSPAAEPAAAHRTHDRQPFRQSAGRPETQETLLQVTEGRAVGAAIVSETAESATSAGPPGWAEPTEPAAEESPRAPGAPSERQQSWQATFKRVREWTAGAPAETDEPSPAAVVETARPDEEHAAVSPPDDRIPASGSPRLARAPIPPESGTADFKLTIGTISVTVEPPPETRSQHTTAAAGPQLATARTATPPPSQYGSSRLARHYIRR